MTATETNPARPGAAPADGSLAALVSDHRSRQRDRLFLPSSLYISTMSSDEGRAEAVALERLQQLGLSQYEAQTLVSLVRLETGTAKDIAQVDDVPRTRVYEAAERLHELGLVDIQHTTPRKFTVISQESIVRTLEVRRENTITDLAENLEEIGPAEPRREQFGAWTVTGREAVAARTDEFIADAEEQIVYMTVDDRLTGEHLDRLAAAEDDGVDIYLAGVSEDVKERIEDRVPSATMFDTLWAWRDTPAASLLVCDEQTALVSALTETSSGGQNVEETAIWGAGERNSLVVVLRAIFTWRLDSEDLS